MRQVCRILFPFKDVGVNTVSRWNQNKVACGTAYDTCFVDGGKLYSHGAGKDERVVCIHLRVY